MEWVGYALHTIFFPSALIFYPHITACRPSVIPAQAGIQVFSSIFTFYFVILLFYFCYLIFFSQPRTSVRESLAWFPVMHLILSPVIPCILLPPASDRLFLPSPVGAASFLAGGVSPRSSNHHHLPQPQRGESINHPSPRTAGILYPLSLSYFVIHKWPDRTIL